MLACLSKYACTVNFICEIIKIKLKNKYVCIHSKQAQSYTKYARVGAVTQMVPHKKVIRCYLLFFCT